MSTIRSLDATHDVDIDLSASQDRERIAAREFLIRRVLDPPRDRLDNGPQISEWVQDAKNQGRLLVLGMDSATEWMTSWTWELKNEKATFAVQELW